MNTISHAINQIMPPRRSSRVKTPAPAPISPSIPQPQRKRTRGAQAKTGSSDQTNKRSKKREEDDKKHHEDIEEEEDDENDDENQNDEEEKREEEVERLASAVPLDTMTSKVFEFSFIVQLMMEYLSDHDSLTNLILTSHAINRSIVRYPVKKVISSRYELTQITGIDLTSTLSSSTSFISPSHKRLCFKSANCRLLEDDRSWLPSSVTTLNETQFTAADPFPSHITDLSLGVLYELNQESIDRLNSGNYFPDQLKSLRTNCMVNVRSIPPSVERLVLNASWKPHLLDAGAIPDTVKDLTLSGRIKLPPTISQMSNVFPSGLIKLSTEDIEFPVPFSFPTSIKDLTIGNCRGNWLALLGPGCLPPSLTRLEIQNGSCNFPLSVATTSSGSSSSSNSQHNVNTAIIRVIPDTVTELIFGVTQNPNNNAELQVSDLPPCLRVLDLGGYTHRLCPGVLPSTLQELTMRGNNGGYPLEAGAIPDGVTHLRLLSHPTITTGFKPITHGIIPSSVLFLEWEYDAKSKPPIVGAIPASVKTLVFGTLFSRALPIGFIPNSVRGLTFGARFKNGSKPLELGVIPFGVKYLRFGDHFDNGAKPLEVGTIPPTVTHLYFPRQSVFANGYQSIFAAIPASVVVLELPSKLTLDQPVARPPVHKKKGPRKYRPNYDGDRWISASESDDEHEWFTYWEMRREFDD